MSAIAPPCKVTLHVHDLGTWTLPALHEIDGAVDLIFDGKAVEVLFNKDVPAALVLALKGRTGIDVARLFSVWIAAGLDFEAAAWSQTLSLHRTLWPGDERPEPEPSLAAASELYDATEAAADLIVDGWVTMK